jgi:predicted unusual protein kinase regulating ubiquinone biosynthesis (AarF/ABC1/UbiB family)
MRWVGWRRGLCGFGLGLGLSFGGQLARAFDETLHAVEQRYGPSISAARAPALNAAVQQTFDRLSEAQQRLAPTNTLFINDITIIDSPTLNAFVVPEKENGVARVRNRVFVTTALLRRVFNGTANSREGLIRLAGILAHELAHPMEKVDAEAFERNHSETAASQAAEIRADSEGMMIAEEAGYPRDAVYQGLQAIFADRAGGSMAAAAASTHPADEVRLGTQRLLMTLRRGWRGIKQALFPEPARARLLTELGSLDEYKKRLAFREPANAAEALQRLEDILLTSGPNVRLETNRLVLALDDHLLKEGRKLTPDEIRRLKEAWNRIMRDVASKEEFATLFTDDNGSARFRAMPDHFEMLDQVPAYRDPEYVKAMVDLPKRPSAMWGHDVAPVTVRVPLDEWVSRVEPLLQEVFSQDPDGWALRRNWSTMMKGVSPEAKVRLARIYHEKLRPLMNPYARLTFDTSSEFDAQQSMVVPLRVNDYDSPTQGFGILRHRYRLMSDPRKTVAQNDARAVMESIWRDRGYWGAMGFAMRANRVDWPQVWSVLGIDSQVGASQLRQAVKAFTNSPAYAEVLQSIAEKQAENQMGASEVLRGQAVYGVSLDWADDTLWPYLNGGRNAAIERNLSRRAVARNGFGASYLLGRPELKQRQQRKFVAQQLGELARHGPLSAEAIVAVGKQSNWELGLPEDENKDHPVLLAEGIDGAPWPASEKARWLREIFLPEPVELNHQKYFKTEHWRNASAGRIFAALRGQGVEPSALRFAQRARRELIDPRHHESNLGPYYDVLADLKAPLLAEIAQARGPQALLELAQLLDPQSGHYTIPGLGNQHAHRDLKDAIVRRFAALNLEAGSPWRTRLWTALTGTGPTSGADELWRSELESVLSSPLNAASHQRLEQALRQKRINGPALQMEVAKKLLNPTVDSLAKKGALDMAAMDRLIRDLNEYVPTGSTRKDKFLESLAWKLNLRGASLKALIEDEKSSNWHKANPLLVNAMSGMSGQITRLPRSARDEMLRYLMDPEGHEFPRAVRGEMERSVLAEVMRMPLSEHERRTKIEESREAMPVAIAQMESLIRDAAPTERIPLIELILSSGAAAPVNQADFPRDVMRQHLGYALGSNEEKLLLAYLAIIPPYEKAVTVAYLLSQKGKGEGSIKAIFEVFQTVGIKFGQMSSVWKLFGEKAAQETKGLKDSAEPLSLYEMETILKEKLPPAEFGRIRRFVKRLGSASLKTVAEVELDDGSHAVVMVQRPFAPDQVASNLALARRFLEEARKQGIEIPGGMLDSILDDLKSQLDDEMKMTLEAKHIGEHAALYARFNREMAPELKGWRFEVPLLTPGFTPQDTVLVTQKAAGVPWGELDPAVQREVGPLIVESSLRGMFREGLFDADRHAGNFLVDPVNKIIYPIDFGQSERFNRAAPWAADDRLHFAEFVRAIGERNPEALANAGLAMSPQRSLPPAQKAALVGELAAALKDPKNASDSDRIIASVNALAGRGVRMDRRFSFGGLKGLMFLQGENYVPPEKFEQSVRKWVTDIHLRKVQKLPGLVGQACGELAGRLLRR